ncbi:DUF3667 domain-containing protein [uncultured Flavobacterium sp.]|uniref:DUF3667 domain-containing protein n=1 Tax=uncultured Flavobacterium sp. TaxID=165435 RepID=UPI0025DE131D|nr:DUF3667 domain-containing protein [uncultured Flavobacterium sp.]
MICKNCGNTFEGNYCSNCGQPAETHAIDMHFVAHDLRHGLFHVDGGIFYSARELFSRPGHAVRDYLEGKRIQHYKPISMLIVLASFYGLFYHALGINIFNAKTDHLFDYSEINEWIIHHFSIITLLILPIASLTSFLIFRKQGYNFTEHVILNSFYSCQKLWVRIFALPLFLLVKDSGAFMEWLLLPDLVLMLWCYMQFFNKLPKLKAFILTLLVAVITLLLVAIISTVILFLVL